MTQHSPEMMDRMGEKNVEGRFMRVRTAIAALLAATIALPLTG